MDSTDLVASTQILWKLLELYGIDPLPLFRQSGLDVDHILEPRARVSLKAVERIWLRGTELIPDPCFGIRAAECWHPSHLDALGFAWLASCTLRDALVRFARFSHIVSEGFDAVLEDTPDGLTLFLGATSGAKQFPAGSDAGAAILVDMCRMNYGSDLNPSGVTFVHPEPACSERHTAFFRCPVRFEAGHDSITLSFSQADQRLPSGNPHLAEINDQVILHYLERLESLGNEKVVNRVKAAIIDMLPSGGVSDDMVAPQLNMSVRSLQRRLNSAGTTFQTLLDETRHDLARAYLKDPSVSLTELTFVLGFSQPSAFSRAYKRWTGKPPSVHQSAALNQKQ